MFKAPSYKTELKIKKKARKKFIKSLKQDSKIEKGKLEVFADYNFTENEVKELFNRVFPQYRYAGMTKSHYDLIITIFFR